MKKLLCLILAGMMTLSLAACGNANIPKEPSTVENKTTAETTAEAGSQADKNEEWEKSIVKVAIDLDPGTVGPYETNNTGRKETLYEVYETLGMCQGRGGEIKGIMAKDWYEESPLVWVIEIYDYITDSKGNQITADDVIWSFGEEGGSSTYKRYLKYIDAIEKIDDYKIKITLNSDNVGCIDNIITQCWIVDEESYKSTGDGMANEAIGTGPYKIVDYTQGSVMTMEARDDYWQKDESKLVRYQFQNVKTIEFHVITERAQQSIALETGDVDIVSTMTANEITRFEGLEEYTVTEATDNNTRVMIFNCNESSVCSNTALRQAICYAIDVEGLLSGVLDGRGDIAYAWGSWQYPDVDASWNDGNYYPYDAEKAKELIKEANAEGKTIRILTNTNGVNQDIATYVQSYLGGVGLNVEILSYEETLAKTYMREFDTFDIYLVYTGAPLYIISCWDDRLSNTIYDNGLNYCGVNDEVLEEKLKTCLNVNSHTTENMTDLHRYITDNALVYGLFNPYIYTATDSNITSVMVNHDCWLLPGCCTYTWN